MTIFEALRKDHDIQRDLLARLVETHGDSDERDKLYQQVRAELHYHAAAEERALYIPMMSIDLTQEKARHSVAEHHEIDELLELLDETDYSATHWLTHACKINKRHRLLASTRKKCSASVQRNVMNKLKNAHAPHGRFLLLAIK